MTAVGSVLAAASAGFLGLTAAIAAAASPAGQLATLITLIGSAVTGLLYQSGAIEKFFSKFSEYVRGVGRDIKDTRDVMKGLTDFATEFAAATHGGTLPAGKQPNKTNRLPETSFNADVLGGGLIPGFFNVGGTFTNALRLARDEQSRLLFAGQGALPGFFGPAVGIGGLARAGLSAHLEQQLRGLDIQRQLNEFTRPTRGGFGGQLAERMFGTSAADNREARAERKTDKLINLTEEMLRVLKRSQPIVIGNG